MCLCHKFSQAVVFRLCTNSPSPMKTNLQWLLYFYLQVLGKFIKFLLKHAITKPIIFWTCCFSPLFQSFPEPSFPGMRACKQTRMTLLLIILVHFIGLHQFKVDFKISTHALVFLILGTSTCKWWTACKTWEWTPSNLQSVLWPGAPTKHHFSGLISSKSGNRLAIPVSLY